MGQRNSCHKKAENCDRVYNLQQCTPSQHFTNTEETHPHLPIQNHLDSEVDEAKGRVEKEKCKKKKRVWPVLFGKRRADQKDTQKTSSAEGEKKDQSADAAVPQSSKKSDNQISSVKDPLQHHLASDVDAAKGERKEEKCRKKKRFWMVLFGHWRPSKKVILQASVHAESDLNVDALQVPAHTESDWNVDALQVPAHNESDWSVDALQVPARIESDWSADALQVPARIESDWSADALQVPARIESDWSADALQVPARIESDWSADALQVLARIKSDWSADALQVPARIESDWSADALQVPARIESDWSADALQVPARIESDWSADALQVPARIESDWSADALQVLARIESDWSADALQVPPRIESDWSVDALQVLARIKSDWSADALQVPARIESDWSADALQVPARIESDWSADTLQVPARIESDWSADALQVPARTESDWSADALQVPARIESDWSADTLQVPARIESDWSADALQVPARIKCDWSEEDLQAPARIKCDWSEEDLQAPACIKCDWSEEDLQAPARIKCDWSEEDLQAPARIKCDWSEEELQAPARFESDWSADALQVPARIKCDWSEEDLQAPVCIKCDWSEEDLLAPARFESDWSADALQTPGHTTSLFHPCSDIFSFYEVGNMLGQGGFGAVYEGRRLKDGFEVAVKIAKKPEHMEYISIPCSPEPLPLEVALLILANKGPRVPQIIQLLDWKDRGEYYTMVLERPIPCEDLFDFVKRHGGRINERLARIVMRQATQAAYISCQRGVFHRDIKHENLLINKDTLEVKLIDFGCGELLHSSVYTTFIGTRMYCPPEFLSKGRYHGEPATVYSLGVLLFSMVCGKFPDSHDLNMINQNLWFTAGLSQEFCQLICACLQCEPTQRLDLGKILQHKWFKVTDVEKTEK